MLQTQHSIDMALHAVFSVQSDFLIGTRTLILYSKCMMLEHFPE